MSRISVDEARDLWLNASDEELQRLAQEVRHQWHEPNHATYMVMRIINYTNVCVAQCDYCAFYVLPNQEGGYVLTREDVFAKIDELLEVGGDLVGFNGGFNPKLPLEFYCELFAAVRERYGDRVEFYALTIAEFVYLADRAKLTHAEAAVRLRDAGVHWITGGGSEILTEDFRKRHAKFNRSKADTACRAQHQQRFALDQPPAINQRVDRGCVGHQQRRAFGKAAFVGKFVR